MSRLSAHAPACAQSSPISIWKVEWVMPKWCGDAVRAIGEEGVAGKAAGHDEMGGQREFGRAHRPDVEIVDARDAGQGEQMRLDLVRIDAARHAGQRHGHRIRAADRREAMKISAGDDQARDRIDPEPAGRTGCARPATTTPAETSASATMCR